MRCNICTKLVESPWYRTDHSGYIVEGCIASDHLGYIDGHFNKALVSWYYRPAAKQHRKMTKT